MPIIHTGAERPSTAQPFEDAIYLRTDQRPVEAASLRPFSSLLETLQRLNRIEGVGLNWDSYGGEPPSHAAVDSTQNLVWTLVNKMFGIVGERAVPYSLAPLSGGGIQVEWRGDNDVIEVEINRAGRYGYLLIHGAGDARSFQEKDDVLESELVDLVRGVVS